MGGFPIWRARRLSNGYRADPSEVVVLVHYIRTAQ